MNQTLSRWRENALHTPCVCSRTPHECGRNRFQFVSVLLCMTGAWLRVLPGPKSAISICAKRTTINVSCRLACKVASQWPRIRGQTSVVSQCYRDGMSWFAGLRRALFLGTSHGSLLDMQFLQNPSCVRTIELGCLSACDLTKSLFFCEGDDDVRCMLCICTGDLLWLALI